jgi:hypothetical protein
MTISITPVNSPVPPGMAGFTPSPSISLAPAHVSPALPVLHVSTTDKRDSIRASNVTSVHRSLPDLRPSQMAVAMSASQASSLATMTLTQLGNYPVAYKVTVLAQDLFLDAIYQEAAGAWKDIDDIPTVGRLSRETLHEVSNSHGRVQSMLPEARREVIESGS